MSICTGVGQTVPGTAVMLVQRGQTNPIPAGCDVCIRQTSELWLTLICPTNVNTISNIMERSVSFTWTDGKGNVVGNDDTLLVAVPGMYTCTADFGDGERDSATSSVGCGLIYIFHAFCFKATLVY